MIFFRLQSLCDALHYIWQGLANRGGESCGGHIRYRQLGGLRLLNR